MLCSAAQEVEVYLASSILDGSSMFFKLMGVLCRSLSLFELGLEKYGQTSVSNFPKFSPMILVVVRLTQIACLPFCYLLFVNR